MFIVKGNKLIILLSFVGVLEGIIWNVILEIGEKFGYDVREELFIRYDVYVVDEVFLIGIVVEVIVVMIVDGRMIGLG